LASAASHTASPVLQGEPYGQRPAHYASECIWKTLYAVRDAKGRFKDIQTYERAHRADLKRKAKSEK